MTNIKHKATIPLSIEGDLEKLKDRRLPECNTDQEIAWEMVISVEKLGFFAFHFPHFLQAR